MGPRSVASVVIKPVLMSDLLSPRGQLWGVASALFSHPFPFLPASRVPEAAVRHRSGCPYLAQTCSRKFQLRFDQHGLALGRTCRGRRPQWTSIT